MMSTLFIVLIMSAGLLACYTWASDKKVSILFQWLSWGAKKEFTTIPGFISLFIVLAITALTSVVVMISEVNNTVSKIFDKPFTGHEIYIYGLIAALITIMLNFIFLGFMRYMDIIQEKVKRSS